MQCKDIPDLPILQFLDKHLGKWATWGDSKHMPTVQDAMPPGTPTALQQAKMGMLMRRKLVAGFDCGCRGDYEITSEGLAYLAEHGEVSVDD